MDEQDYADSLDAYLAYEDDHTGLTDDPPAVTRPEDANRMLRIITRAQHAIAQARAVADAERAKIAAWEEREVARPHGTLTWAVGQLEAWARAQAARQTWHLPAGDVIVKKPGAGRVVVHDETELMEWLDAKDDRQPEWSKTVTSPMPGAIRKAAQEKELEADEAEGADPEKVILHLVIDGEVIPGIHVEQLAADVFDYKLPAISTDPEETDTPPE